MDLFFHFHLFSEMFIFFCLYIFPTCLLVYVSLVIQAVGLKLREWICRRFCFFTWKLERFGTVYGQFHIPLNGFTFVPSVIWKKHAARFFKMPGNPFERDSKIDQKNIPSHPPANRMYLCVYSGVPNVYQCPFVYSYSQISTVRYLILPGTNRSGLLWPQMFMEAFC